MSCKCDLRTRAVGDGCRYCNPQEYIDKLHEQDADYKSEIANLEQQLRNMAALVEKKNEALRSIYDSVGRMSQNEAKNTATQALALTAEDVELVEVGEADFDKPAGTVNLDIYNIDFDGLHKLYTIKTKE